ncbi:hypothetical protein TNCV_1998101 [Trichonephila clavipes]|uniref:Uncharacterized protein n=1 Tax=Trichonephila clavipes TaxID=2585209 RepID=A0A8X6V2R2_TRICX|nr:hypothetical protein TNCV_1998101 [Trichonephila clavipes]
MYSSALSIEIISDVEFSRRLVESRSDKLKQVKSRKQFNSPPQLENQSQCRRKTTQLVSRNETTELNRRKQLNSAAGTNNSTQQQERTTQLGSRNETTQQEKTTQLVSMNETTQLCTAVDRLQPSTTACIRLQPPATAYNRLQPPLQQNRLFLPTSV